jgi:hypothetical protein
MPYKKRGFKPLIGPLFFGSCLLALPDLVFAQGASDAAASKPAQTAAVSATKPKTASSIKEPVSAKGCLGAPGGAKPYFVEFRSRTAASYGHTFVFYGRLGGGTRFGSFQVAGLHPAGDSAATYISGHVVPVPAETGVSDGDLDEQYLTARWCVPLTETEFQKVSATVKRLQATKKTWHAMGYNCNAFAGEIAEAIGLKIPSGHLVYPEVYINSLRELNRRGQEVQNVPYVQWGMKPPAASPAGRL